MRITKILAAILALALMLSLFACGDKPEETTTSKPEETTAPKETKETTAEDTTEEITTVEEIEEPIAEETTKAEATEAKTEETTTVTETTATETTATETTATETETETVTESDTVSETDTEETTRFDYFGADMNEYVSLESGALESIEIEISSEYLIDENDVKEYVEGIRLENRIPLNNGAQVSDQAIKLGDSAYIYFNGTINGEAFEGGSNWEDPKPLELAIGYDDFLPGFDEQLIGIIPTSTSKEAPIKISTAFPADYWDESLAGTEIVFDVWVVYIVQYELPEYNADFILDVLEYETEESCTDVVAEFEASVLAELKAEAEYWEEYDKEAALADYLVDKMTVVKYPESELAHYYNNIYSQLVEYMEFYQSMGMEFDSFGDFVILVMELEEGADWHAALMEAYVYPMVNQHLMIHSVAQELNITVTIDDCQAYLEEQMEETDMTAEEIIEELGGYYMLKETVLYEKMIDTLLETVIVLYV